MQLKLNFKETWLHFMWIEFILWFLLVLSHAVYRHMNKYHNPVCVALILFKVLQEMCYPFFFSAIWNSRRKIIDVFKSFHGC